MTDQVEKRTLKEKICYRLDKAFDYVENNPEVKIALACGAVGCICSTLAYLKGYDKGTKIGQDYGEARGEFSGYVQGIEATLAMIYSCSGNREDS